MLWKTDSKSNYIYYRSDHKIFIGFSSIPPLLYEFIWTAHFCQLARKHEIKFMIFSYLILSAALKITRSNCFPYFLEFMRKNNYFQISLKVLMTESNYKEMKSVFWRKPFKECCKKHPGETLTPPPRTWNSFILYYFRSSLVSKALVILSSLPLRTSF